MHLNGSTFKNAFIIAAKPKVLAATISCPSCLYINGNKRPRKRFDKKPK